MGSEFEDGTAYERFMGRWSRLVAADFVSALDVGTGAAWADVGCGTGVLTETVLRLCDPARVVGIDPSPEQLEVARAQVDDPRASFAVGGAGDVGTVLDGPVDAVVAGLVLNFVPDPLAAVRAMRGAAPGGLVAAYLWDYEDGMQMLKLFWDAAAAVVPGAHAQDGARRVAGRPEALQRLWDEAGLHDVRTWAVDVPAHFSDDDDLWGPFLLGVGPPGRFIAALDDDQREALRAHLLDAAPRGGSGGRQLSCRAWAVAGRS